VPIPILGIFEDGTFRDFVTGIVERHASQHGFAVHLQPFLTNGCNFDNLRDHLARETAQAGVLVGVDGKRTSAREKIDRLRARADITNEYARPALWAVASPSIEAWLMADPEGVHHVLAELYGASAVRATARPAAPASESTAKSALRSWTGRILGRPLLRGGCEHAQEIGRALDPNRLGRRRTPNLWRFVREDLPRFLEDLARSP